MMDAGIFLAMNNSLNLERRPTRVLLADDMPQVLRDLHQLLDLTGAMSVVGEASNGEQAVQLAAQLQPDAVVMDLEMPGMGGYEATRRIRAQFPKVRVIILSVHAEAAEQEHARDAGADAFVIKGASYEVLVKAILESGTASAGKEGKDE